MKLLFITNKVNSYALGFQNVLNTLLSLGHDVIWAADFSNFNGDRAAIPCLTYQLPINSNPANRQNIVAYKSLCEMIDKEKIDAIQCSTPIGGLLGRLVGHKKKIHTVIYAAHGFLFFKGAPFINNTLYKLEEIWLAHYTDILITINEEDFKAA